MKTGGLCTAVVMICLWGDPCAAEVNVVEAGADPNGVTDCTALLSSLHASGDRVYYPNGTYRFNGRTLDLRGGVRFESAAGVTICNDRSPANVLQFDDAGNLIGLQQNHLELDDTDLGGHLPTGCGSLVPPPLSGRPLTRSLDLLAHWYNDGGLECRRHGGGWIGWYYWSWNSHRPLSENADPYDPARHPLLGFYLGDDPVVLDWQCYWLREYGVAGVILQMGDDLSRWQDPLDGNHWLWVLMNQTPNFAGLRYVLSMPTPYASASPETQVTVEGKWRALLELLPHYPNVYCMEREGRRYPLLYLHEEGGLTGVFDDYNGCARTLDFYRRMAAVLHAQGFDGMALLARHGIGSAQADFDALEREGIIHLTGSYSDDLSQGATYPERVAAYAPPVDPRLVLNVNTAMHSHTPHPSAWNCPGHTPALFGDLLGRAVDHVLAHGMPRLITCYNVAEWAEGGPGLQPNMQDRFGYLDAVRDVVLTGQNPPDLGRQP